MTQLDNYGVNSSLVLRNSKCFLIELAIHSPQIYAPVCASPSLRFELHIHIRAPRIARDESPLSISVVIPVAINAECHDSASVLAEVKFLTVHIKWLPTGVPLNRPSLAGLTSN